jgi:uncharacterized protein YegL
MTRPNYTEIIAIIDRSASMGSLTTETVSGYNSFLKEQKEIEDETNLSLVLFNDRHEYIYDNVPIKKVKKLSKKIYMPHGMTAMNDAIGTAITKAGARLAKMEEHERPSKVIVLIITDGQENSSREYRSSSQIKEMIDKQQNTYSWEFIFLGANIDVDQYAADYGFKAGKFAQYNQTSKGTTAVFDSLSTAVVNARGFSKSSNGSTQKYSGTINYDINTLYQDAEKK